MDKKVIKIAAIVVTFNRKNLFPKCIEGIFLQNTPVDHVFLIDNASNDGTKETIDQLYKNNPLITPIILPENTGSAGGFHEGVKAAYEWGADWIWLLDDDVKPESDCLKTLLQYQHISQCIHPSKKDSNGAEFIWESIFDPAIGRTTVMPNISFKNGKSFTFINIGCFEGMLIHRDIVSKIGFPDKRFFITSDDMVYGFIASLYTNVLYVKDAIIHKLIPFNDQISPIFLYYYVRNQFLVKEYLQKYDVYNRRLFAIYFRLFVILACTKHMLRNKSLQTIRYVFKGIRDGRKGKFYKINS